MTFCNRKRYNMNLICNFQKNMHGLLLSFIHIFLMYIFSIRFSQKERKNWICQKKNLYDITQNPGNESQTFIGIIYMYVIIFMKYICTLHMKWKSSKNIRKNLLEIYAYVIAAARRRWWRHIATKMDFFLFKLLNVLVNQNEVSIIWMQFNLIMRISHFFSAPIKYIEVKFHILYIRVQCDFITTDIYAVDVGESLFW